MKANVHWPLMIFYCGIEGWVLAFPLFGPILAPFAALHGGNASSLATMFLFSFGASFAAWGYILKPYSRSVAPLRVPVLSAIAVCIALDVSLLVVPAALWPIFFVLFGVFGSIPTLVWLTFVSQGMDRRKIGWNLGITGVFVELIVYTVRMFGQYVSPQFEFILIQALPLVAFLTLMRFPTLFDSRLSVNHEPESTSPGRWMLYLFIFSFPLVGGIMYSVVQPLFLADYPRILASYGSLPYVLTMPLAGFLADRKSIRPVALYGLAALGVAYTVFDLSKSGWAAFTGDTFLNIGFAFMDLFVLFVLAWYAPPRQRTTLYIGVGLSVYIFSILAGTWLSQLITPTTRGNYNIIYLIAVLIMFVSFFLLEWIVRKVEVPALPYQTINEDLELARQVQQNMLPRRTDLPKGLEIAFTLEPAREVGGDFFDAIALRENRTLFVVGDVMGKGLPAAMLVSSVIGQIRSRVESVQSLPDLLWHVNRVLIRDARFSMYVTVGLVLLDAEKKTLTHASAGHMHPYVSRRGRVTALECSSLPLGTDFDMAFEEDEVALEPGDLLLLYTDGVIEAKNKRKEFYSFERLEEQLSLCVGLTAEEVNRHIAGDLKAFAGTESFEDDFTLLVVRT